VVANLSRFVQYTELDLSALVGRGVVEMFSGNEFPSINERPYFLTLAPHAFYWFALESRVAPPDIRPSLPQIPLLAGNGTGVSLFANGNTTALERALLTYLKQQRWFGGKARAVRSVAIPEIMRLPATAECYAISVLVTYTEGDP